MSSTGSNSLDGKSGAERRRYVRQPIRLDAKISIQGRNPLSCVVRDFCVAGIFVQLAPEYLHDLTRHTKATLNFFLTVDGVERPLQLGLTIFRLVGNGIGCGFNTPDPKTIALLQRFADASNAPVPDNDAAYRETQSGFRPIFLTIKDELITLCEQRVAGLAEDFIRVADENLFLAARDAGNNRDETRYLDGLNEFKGRKSSLKTDVPALIRKAIQIINSPVKSSIEQNNGGDELPELSLIDKEDFEEFLTVSELISELEPKFKSQLFEIERRFEYLAKRKIDEQNNPLGPQVICNIFAESLKNLQSDRIATVVIYKGLRKALDAGLGRLYDSVNRFFVDKDVLPVIEKEKPGYKNKSKSRPRRERAIDPEIAHEPQTQEADFAATWGGGVPQSTGGAHVPGLSGGATSASAAPPLAPLQPGLAPPGNSQPSGTMPFAGGPTSSNQGVPAGGSQGGSAGYVGSGSAGGGYVGTAPGVPHTGMPGQTSAAAPATNFVSGGVDPGHPGAAPVVPGSAAPGIAHSAINPNQPSPAAGVATAFDTTFGGFVGAPAVYSTPSLQQAYSTAQTQIALRRDLNQLVTGAPAPAPIGGAYQIEQVVGGLTAVQQSMAGETNPGMLEVESIKERIMKSIQESGGGEGHIGQQEADAIEVIANLFKSLISDAYLTEGARNNIARLQAPVHKVALMDQDFFESTNHPVRQVLNRVALVDDSVDENGIAQNHRISALIDQVNRQFTDDVSVFNPVVGELDEILRDQRTRYQENVEAVVEASMEQQRILRDRKSKDLSATDSSGARKKLPEEWNKWLDRVKALAVGDRFIMNANTNNPFPVSLVWIGEDNEPFVLVDQKGHKVSTLTMQQVAMYLRRGTLKLLDPNAAGAVDRALFGMVNRMHGDVEDKVTRDELTTFLTRKSFLQAIEKNLPTEPKKDNGGVLSQISIVNLKNINERDGVEVGDKLLENVARTLVDTLGEKTMIFGRLSGAELAVYWPRGGVISAQNKLQDCFERFKELDLTDSDSPLELDIAAGMVAVDDNLTMAADLLSVVGEACATAKNDPNKTIYIAGSENKYKEKLEQMVSYLSKAIDRERLVFLIQKVKSLSDSAQTPAAHVVVSAEDRNGKIIPPLLFEQALEKSERAFEIDTWVIKKSLAWMRDDEKVLESYSAIIIPLSASAVRRDDLANTVITELMETAVPPGRIAFEIADKNVVANLTEVTDMMRTLTEFGCRFILDEFGSGQDNYDYLKELPADFVTIQSDFIREAGENQKDFAMAKSINELAHFMGKRTLAKQERGTEIQATLEELGIDFIFDRSRSSRIAEANV